MSLKLEAGYEPTTPSNNLAAQIDRILHSNAFRGSETLRSLLSYLSLCAIQTPGMPVKVRAIAKAVFGRAEDFDSQTDSIVRVHTGRLRSKLAEFYLSEGANDDFIVSIPKGSYNIAWELRARTQSHEDAPEPATESLAPEPVLVEPASRGRVGIRWWAAVLCAFLVGWMGANLFRAQSERTRVPDALRTFWNGFVTSPGAPIIVFSNLTMHDVSPHPGDPIANIFTTTGEVMGVFQISRMLTLLNKPARAKPGALLTWDDAKDSDLVFVGGPLAETPLRDVALFKEFQFKPGVPPQQGSIVNLHPRKGEAAAYFGDSTRPGQFDYGLIALGPALDPNRHALALAGIDYYGTQAAAEFVTRPDKMQDLLSRLNVKVGNPMPSFEALIYVKNHGGVPVQSEIVTIRRLTGTLVHR